MGWGARHLTIIVGTGGGAFANKNCLQGRACELFFQMPGVYPGVCPGGGGMLVAGIDSHINNDDNNNNDNNKNNNNNNNNNNKITVALL